MTNEKRICKFLKVAGIAACVCVVALPMMAMVQPERKSNPEQKTPVVKKDSVKVVDLTKGNPDAVLYVGRCLIRKQKIHYLEQLLC